MGLNYRGHCEEQNIPLPKEPMIFSKFSSTIVGPHDNVVIPPITDVSNQIIFLYYILNVFHITKFIIVYFEPFAAFKIYQPS